MSFEHRRSWIEARILELGNVFAVAIHAYAVMSNHIHVVLDIDPSAPAGWSNEDIARRWLSLTRKSESDGLSEDRIRQLVEQPERLEEIRRRLGNLSWFMRLLKEPIARRANREDGCKGRFWEGRFRVQALLDDAAVLACMAYVDLNPARAGIVSNPIHARHTSLRRRVDAPSAAPDLSPVAASITPQIPLVSEEGYFVLIDWTFRALTESEPDHVRDAAVSIVRNLGYCPSQWLAQVPATESDYFRVIGSVESIVERARLLGRHWLCGLGMARSVQRLTA